MLLTKVRFAAAAALLLAVCAMVFALGWFMPPADKVDQPEGAVAKADESDSKRLQGTWHVVEMEVGGVPQSEDHFKQIRIVVTNNTMAMMWPVPNGRDAIDEATFVLDEKAKPKRLDAQKGGRTVFGIYALEENLLKLCIDLDGKKRPAGFETENGSRQHSYVLKRHVDSKNAGRRSDVSNVNRTRIRLPRPEPSRDGPPADPESPMRQLVRP